VECPQYSNWLESARLHVHQLFTSCIRQGLMSRFNSIWLLAACDSVMSALSAMLSNCVGHHRKCGDWL